jgi:lipid II:glycine glycyltransferase (peptidoglycan interpeptide bridge formation enzyme)
VARHWSTVQLNETAVVDLERPVEAFLPSLRNDHRQGVRKAIRAGVRVRPGRTPADLDAFCDLYHASMTSAGAAGFYRFGRGFFARHLELLGARASVLLAEIDGRPAAASMFLFGERFAHYHFAGLDRELAALAPNKLLLYEAMLLARERGCVRLHLGGGRGGGEDSLMMFKRGFTRDRAAYHLGKRILDSPAHAEACRRRGIDPAVEPLFPAYRGRPGRGLAT